ncbi:uncharacterized protein DSM5745_03462 [Aspergillus mulundensis]|uniref:Uncharacterized protein n=1 Tax=Aspergillus mulundensis TaxID=1810919 RepID=A0A3D8SKG6_9EURO|nr:hypothetical protein DSM5745_03462 [Aspergillus mulundensis]RDW86820.1 hypothetical protein DSM5745_03462 [Aspergillus mulundensis]
MPPSQANEDQHKSPPDMYHKTAPKQILQRKQISQQEYDLREEWAPETVNDYQVTPNNPLPAAPHDQAQLQPKPNQGGWEPYNTEERHSLHQPQHYQHAATIAGPSANANTNTNNKQGRVLNRRSTLFEEWKAKSLRSPEQVEEARAVQRENKTGNRRINTSGDVRVAMGERFDKAGSGQVKHKPKNDSRGRQVGLINNKSNAVSGDARKPLVEHTAEASNIPKSELANTQLADLNKTKDITTSGGTEKTLKEPLNGTADTEAKTEPAKKGLIHQAKTQDNAVPEDANKPIRALVESADGHAKIQPANHGYIQQPEVNDHQHKINFGDVIEPSAEPSTGTSDVQAKTKSVENDLTQQPGAETQESSAIAETQTKPELANRNLPQHNEKDNTEDSITRDAGQTMSGDTKAPLDGLSGGTPDTQTKANLETDGCVPETAVTKTEDTITSKGTIRDKRKNSKRAAVLQAKPLPSNDGSNQQPEENKAGNVIEVAHHSAPSSDKVNAPMSVPMVKPRENTRGRSNRKGRTSNNQVEDPERQCSRERQAAQADQPCHTRQSSRGRPGLQEHQASLGLQTSQATRPINARQPSKERQGSHAHHPSQSRQVPVERQQRSRERSSEQVAYTAPNGTQLTVEELRRLGNGNILAGKDKVYFMPCFIEDPWSGLIPVPVTRPRDLMFRF